MSARQAPQLCWERLLPGRNPRQVLFGDDCLVVDYIDDQGRGGTAGASAAVCMDFDGNERWRAPRIRLGCALAGNKFLATAESGETIIIHAKDGHAEEWGAELGVGHTTTRTWRQGEHVFLLIKEKLLIADLWLRPIRQVALTTNHGAFFADGHVYLESGSIMFSDFDRSRVLCRVPSDMAEAAMARWERETGKPAIWGTIVDGPFDPSTIVASIMDAKKQRAIAVGHRMRFRWLLRVEPQMGVVFLANGDSPHLLACVGLDGQPRWCVYLSGACCGGLPRLLPNGRHVVSSGCGGILTWIDHNGCVLAQSKPYERLSNRVIELPDSGCLVEGERGIVSFDADGQVRWVWKHPSTNLGCAPARDRLVAVSWTSRRDDSKILSIACARGLGLGAFVS
jgi:hypothetical protein